MFGGIDRAFIGTNTVFGGMDRAFIGIKVISQRIKASKQDEFALFEN